MTQRHQSILLILMMLITPITSAFEHCVGMDMSVHLSDIQNTSGHIVSHDTSAIDHKTVLENDLGSEGHNDANCTVHICGAYDLPLSPVIAKITRSSYYINIEYSAPYGIALSPDLRPPRQIL